MNDLDISGIVSSYGIGFGKLREDIPLFGSPERTEYRVAFEDAGGKSFIFEEVAPERLEKKKAIARTLSALALVDPTLPIAPYLRHAGGEHILEIDDRYFQVVLYIEGVALDRTGYLGDDWRGIAAAEYLIGMRRASASLRPDETGPIPGPFLLGPYTDELVGKIKRKDPDVLPGIMPVLDSLGQSFFSEGSVDVCRVLSRRLSSREHHLERTRNRGCDRLGIRRTEGTLVRCREYGRVSRHGRPGRSQGRNRGRLSPDASHIRRVRER